MKSEKFDKNDVERIVRTINSTVESCSNDNCYDQVLQFFMLTSLLQEHKDDIEKLPIKGHRFLYIKTDTRKNAEEQREKFFTELEKLGRNSHHNKSRLGEPITKEKIFFGDCTFSIARCETFRHDMELQDKIRTEIMAFLWLHKHSLEVDWLRSR